MTAIQRQRPNRQYKACRKPKTAVLTNIAECANDSHFLNYVSSTLLLPLPLLQIDAVSLFLLYLVEMICSGLQIIYNTDEVNNTLKWPLRWSILSTRDLQPVPLYWSDIFWAHPPVAISLLLRRLLPLLTTSHLLYTFYCVCLLYTACLEVF